jgi:hypothetical protein
MWMRSVTPLKHIVSNFLQQSPLYPIRWLKDLPILAQNYPRLHLIKRKKGGNVRMT